MFERRLWFLLTLMFAAAISLALRLYQLQVIRGGEYREKSDAVLVRAPADLPAVRGRTLDRNGLLLASDEPAVDVNVHYGVLSWSSKYLADLAKTIRREPAWRKRTVAESRDEAARRVGDMWTALMTVTGLSRDELRERGEQIVTRVEALRRYIAAHRRNSGNASSRPVELREERSLHPIIRDISPDVRAKLESQIAAYPFVRLEPAVRRRYRDDPAMRSIAHLLGRLGQVSPDQVAQGGDEDDAYRPGDLVGVSGVEQLAEAALRGHRGSETRDMDGNLRAGKPPVDGGDVRLTIDTDLQQQIYELLARAVAEHPPSTGAACVVLSLPQRECLAVVSYPSFDPKSLATDYVKLRDDPVHQPLWPRAIATAYAPGSIVKPATLLAGLAGGHISPSMQVNCQGQLFPNLNAWHCWTYWNHLAPHGVVNGITAIQHSCNVFFYTVGQKIGPVALTDSDRTLLYGPGDAGAEPMWHGTGLREEADGLVPSEARLHRTLTDADARNFAIGQGELMLTPLQAANLAATFASGDFLDPTLIHADQPRTPAAFPNIQPEHWRMIREGMYRCANQPGGSAFPHVKMDNLVVCGKTGSAESVPLVSKREYVFAGTDGTERAIEAPTVEAARTALGIRGDEKPLRSKAVTFWPPRRTEGKQTTPTHAWCIAFAPRDRPCIALSVVIEYGGGGGKVAAPVAKQVFDALINSPHEYLPHDRAVAARRKTVDTQAVALESEP